MGRQIPWVVPCDRSANQRVLQVSNLLGAVEPAILAELARDATRARFGRGDYVWRAGDPATWLTIIASGLVKIAQSTADGGETILALFGPRESIGDMALVGRRPYPASAIVASDATEVIRVDAAVVHAAMTSHPSLVAALNASLVGHSQALHEKIRIMTAGAVPKRLATLLLSLAKRFGDDGDDGSTVIPLLLSRSECARLVGATVETTIRTFTRWERDGLVETTQGGFALHDPAALEQITFE